MERDVYIYRASYEQEELDAVVEKVFSALPAAQALTAETKVLLKPNLLAKHPPEAAVTTHPAVVRAVIHALKRRGVAHIVLADSGGGPHSAALAKGVYKTSGLWQVCEEEGAACDTELDYAVKAVPNGRAVREFPLLRAVLDADFIIDLAKFKTHVMTGCSAATKNLFGCIPGLQKAELHMRFPQKERFGDMLIDLLETVRPQIAIVDGILAMEGDGPAGGKPRELGLLLGGEDPLTVDLAVCGLMGLDPMRVPYLAAAHRRGLCEKVLDPSLIKGEAALYAPIPGFLHPKSYEGGELDFSHHVPSFLRPVVKAVEEKIAPKPVVEAKKCVSCGKCAQICPHGAITIAERAKIQPARCIRCFCCHEMCPVKAIQVKSWRIFRV